MKLLAIDTSTLIAGVAVSDGAAHSAVRRGRVTSHSDELLLMIDTVIREIGFAPRDLDGIVCGAGPGSFTGLRIGLSTAKGLAYSLDRPLLLISSLAALAARAPDGLTYAILNAHKAEVYVGGFDVVDGLPTLRGAERVLPPDQLVKELDELSTPPRVVGDGLDAYPQLRGTRTRVDDDPAPHPLDLIRLGAHALATGATSDLDHGAPHYIRASEAEVMKAAKKL